MAPSGYGGKRLYNGQDDSQCGGARWVWWETRWDGERWVGMTSEHEVGSEGARLTKQDPHWVLPRETEVIETPCGE